MMTILEILTYENIVFRGYMTWSAILILKIFGMGTLTSFHRFKTKVNNLSILKNKIIITTFFVQTFSNPEDTNLSKDSVVGFGNVDVERIRRAHRNDLREYFTFSNNWFILRSNRSRSINCK